MYRFIYLGQNIPPISSYNLFLGIGMIAFFLSLERVIRKNAISFRLGDRIKVIVLYSAVLGILGAVFGEAFYHQAEGALTFSGFTFYGGLIAALFAVWGFSSQKQLDFIYVANILTVPFVLAHAFGRIGCFLGGCCFGRPTNSFAGVIFPDSSMPHMQYGVQAVHPTQLYESSFLFLLYVLLTFAPLKWRFIFYLLSYPSFRYMVEYFRGDNRGYLFFESFSPSQTISIVLFFVGLFLLYSKRNDLMGLSCLSS